MSEVTIILPDNRWFESGCNVYPQDKQLCVVIHKYGNQTPKIYQFRKADWLYDKEDYFLDVSERWEFESLMDSEMGGDWSGWNPSFATFNIIRRWKPLGLPANDNERLLMEIEKWFED